MSEFYREVERACLMGDIDTLSHLQSGGELSSSEKNVVLVCKMLVEGHFSSPFKDDEGIDACKKIASLDDASDERSQCISRVSDFIGLGDGERGAEAMGNALLVLYTGVCLFKSFLQANWTGPDVPTWFKDKCSDHLNRIAIDQLESGGEAVYSETLLLPLLLKAEWLLCGLHDALSARGEKDLPHPAEPTTLRVWRARLAMARQWCLMGSSYKLREIALDGLGSDGEDSSDSSLHLSIDEKAARRLERGLVYHYYGEDKLAKKAFREAQEISGLTTRMTGAMGKRTRYQSFETAQLVLQAHSREDDDGEKDDGKEDEVKKDDGKEDDGKEDDGKEGDGKEDDGNEDDGKDTELARRAGVREVELTDDTVLPNIAFSKEQDTRPLRVVDQAILLALCLDVKNTNPRHGLTNEEMRPYVARVETHPSNWLVHTACLLQRSRLELVRSRTADRAVLQMQVLLDQWADEEEEVAVSERMRYIHLLAFPPRHALKKEVGKAYLSMGVAYSALQIFEQLKMWEEVIECYRVIGKTKKAEELCLSLLQKEGQTNLPNLWCVLGDLRGGEGTEEYEEAWTISGYRCARAKRSIGRTLFTKGNLKDACAAYAAALKINPLYKGAWFTCGCGYMRLGEWAAAAHAFKWCVRLDGRNGEAWSNLASVYLKQDKKREALIALAEGVKHARDSWRMWQNYLYVSMDLGEYQKAIEAERRLLQLKPDSVDVDALDYLVGLVLREDGTDCHGTPGRVLLPRVKALMDEVMGARSTPEIFACACRLAEGMGELHQAVELKAKEVRALKAMHGRAWQTEQEIWAPVGTSVAQLGRLALGSRSRRAVAAARLQVRGTLKKAKELSNTEEYEKCDALLTALVAHEKALKEAEQ